MTLLSSDKANYLRSAIACKTSAIPTWLMFVELTSSHNSFDPVSKCLAIIFAPWSPRGFPKKYEHGSDIERCIEERNRCLNSIIFREPWALTMQINSTHKNRRSCYDRLESHQMTYFWQRHRAKTWYLNESTLCILLHKYFCAYAPTILWHIQLVSFTRFHDLRVAQTNAAL